MFWTLLTAFIAGVAGGLFGLALRHMSGKRLPKGIIPVSAGLAMIAATVGMEYGWYENVRDTMAPDTVVISERQQQAWYQPWTFVNPWVRGFLSYSPSETTETAAGSGIDVVQVRLQERWQPEIVLPILVDCANGRRAEIRPETEFSDAGMPTNAQWIDAGLSDPVLSTVCAEETTD